MIVDVSEKELTDAQDALAKEGFAAQMTICVWTDAAGQRHYAGIWSNQGAPSELRAAYAGFELVHEPQWDVAVAPAAKLSWPIRSTPIASSWHRSPHYHAAQVDEPQQRLHALARSITSVSWNRPWPTWIFWSRNRPSPRRCCNIALGHWPGWARWTRPAPSWRSTWNRTKIPRRRPTCRSCWRLGSGNWTRQHSNWTLWSRPLHRMQTPCTTPPAQRHSRPKPVRSRTPTRSQQFADRAIELLGTAITHGYDDAQQLRTDVDFARLHGDPRFLALLEKLEPPARYAAVWRADVEFESRLTALQSPESLLEQARELASTGISSCRDCRLRAARRRDNRFLTSRLPPPA